MNDCDAIQKIFYGILNNSLIGCLPRWDRNPNKFQNKILVFGFDQESLGPIASYVVKDIKIMN